MNSARFSLDSHFLLFQQRVQPLFPFILILYSYLAIGSILFMIAKPSLELFMTTLVGIALPVGIVAWLAFFRRSSPIISEFENEGLTLKFPQGEKFIRYDEMTKTTQWSSGIFFINTKNKKIKVGSYVTADGPVFFKELIKRAPQLSSEQITQVINSHELMVQSKVQHPAPVSLKKSFLYMLVINILFTAGYSLMLPVSIGMPADKISEILSYSLKMSWSACMFVSVLMAGIYTVGCALLRDLQWPQMFSLNSLQQKVKLQANYKMLAVTYAVIFGLCLGVIHNDWRNGKQARELASTVATKFHAQK